MAALSSPAHGAAHRPPPQPAPPASRHDAARVPALPRWARPAALRAGRRRRGWPVQISRAGRRQKRWLDRALCVVAALPAALAVALAACAVRWETPGPVLFAQWRVGAHGRPFRLWKLRTMVANAAELKAQLADRNELPWPDFKIANDPRITRVGRLLRRTSLDELPQLWNIWRGEMSWVGPRPTSFGLERYQLWQTERLATPPGLTGLWQVTARAECSFDQRLRLDLAYVRGWHLGLDLRILAATARIVLSGRGAK